MSTPASIRRHPIHPMLIVFPIALWVFSLVCDIVYHAGSHNALWKEIAFYTMAGGVVGALLAAIPGFVDYLSITDRRTKRVATTHMALNLVVTLMFIFNLGIRYNASPDGELFGVMVSLVAIGLMSISGWLGGSLVYEHGVGIGPAHREKDRERRAA
jgi:uncharacterized membrane protein